MFLILKRIFLNSYIELTLNKSKMKKTGILAIASLLLVACTNEPKVAENEFWIEGTLENVEDGEILRLFREENGALREVAKDASEGMTSVVWAITLPRHGPTYGLLLERRSRLREKTRTSELGRWRAISKNKKTRISFRKLCGWNGKRRDGLQWNRINGTA